MSELPAPHGEQPSARRASLPSRMNARRQATRERIHAKVVHPIDTPRLISDPLERRESRVSSALTGARVLVGAVAIHGLVIVGFAVVGTLVGKHTVFRQPERLTVNIVEAPKPEPPPVELPPPVEAPVEPEFQPVSPPKKLDTPKKPEKVVDAPPPPAPQPVEQAPIPRRVVGLNMESTVAGTGPVFAIGTSRMGTTDTHATDPNRAQQPAGAPTQQAAVSGPSGATPPQRAAAHIPTRDTAFEKPKRLSPIRPEFPATLKAQGMEGDVLVQVDIAVDGRVTTVAIVRSSGHPAFDEAAKRAAAGERFAPATRDGKPVAFTLTYSYRFRIED